MSRRRFEQFEHTADTGLRVYGSDLRDLLLNAADGMSDLMFDVSKIRPRQEREVVVEEANAEELLVGWLQWIIILLDSEQFLCREAEISELTDTRLRGVFRGEPLDPDRHEVYHAVKAVTYHELKIRGAEDGLMVEIVLDV